MDIINRMAIWICVGIYEVVSYAFRVFLILAKNELFDSTSYANILKNFYIIIGIVMLFVLAFALLRGMVNPDEQKQGTAMVKKVIVNLVTSFIGLAVLPTIFAFAYDFQDSLIMTQNVFGQLFGNGTSVSTDGGIEQGANKITNGVFTAFFREDPDVVDEAFNSDNVSLSDIKAQVDINGDFSAYTDFADAVTDGKIVFNFLISLLAGLLLIYVAVSFCFDMALRAVKLFFYQLIAPLPLFFRIMPEGKLSGVFNNWVKVTLTCYLEVYIRILVFYLAIFLCQIVIDTDPFNTISGGTTSVMAKAFTIMGIVMFMKQAPKLLSEVTGLDSGNMKLGIKDKMKDAGVFTAAAALGAGATAGVRNAVHAGNKWKEAKGFKEKAKALGSGIVSTVAGAGSGFVRGGRAGISAGNLSDMRNAAGTGARGATDSRNRREAYRVQHEGENIIRARFNDKVDDIKAWARGGFEAEDSRLNAYNEVLATIDRAKSSTEKVMAKYGTNAKIVKMLEAAKYKGVSLAEATEFNNLFNGANLSTMENTINALKEVKIERSQYQTDAQFEKALRDHNAKVAAYDSMYQQVRKATYQNIESLALLRLTGNPNNEVDKYFASIGVSKDDLTAVESELVTAQNQLNAMGRGQDVDFKTKFIRDNNNNIVGHEGAGESFKAASDVIEQERNALSAEVARQKAERAARKQNNGS